MAEGSTPLRMPANANATMKTSAEEAEGAADVAAKPVEEPARVIKVRRRGRGRRLFLFMLLPVALVAGGYTYVTGGQILSTDNAYVAADMVGVTTDIAGIIASIEVHESEEVKAGQVLFRLRPEPFEITLAGAKAELGAARIQILTLQASYKQTLAQIAQAKADVPFFQTSFERQKSLVSSAAASHAAYDEAKHNLDSALEKVDVAKAQAAATLAQLGGNVDAPVEQNPTYLQAQAKVYDAQRELDHTVVRAAFDGIVTNVSALQVGAYLDKAQQGFSLVSSKNMWIDASPKETELTNVLPGQAVKIFVDTYPGVEWSGKVASISPASGSSFSLLPAQNTSGNWVKVVQRIPMRVTIEDTSGKPPLRVGMSTTVEVDTGKPRGLPDFAQKLIDRIDGKDHG